jgi:hypothetical protein
MKKNLIIIGLCMILLVMGFVNAVSYADIQRGNVLWWNTVNTTGNISGSTVIDKSGHSNHGTIYNVSCGVTNCSWKNKTSGTMGHINLPYTLNFTNISVYLIFNFGFSGSGNQEWWQQDVSGSNGFVLYANPGENQTEVYQDGNVAYTNNNSLVRNSINRLLVVKNSSNVKLYVNGSDETAFSDNFINNSIRIATLGRSDGTGSIFNGSSFLFAIWNRSLGVDEINYLQGKGNYYNPYSGLFDLNISIYSESNNTLINSNVSVTLSSINYSYVSSTVTGNVVVSAYSGTYQILLSGVGYSDKTYEVTLDSGLLDSKSINVTMIPNSSSTIFTINVQDSLNRVIPDARIIISRAYVGVWTVVADSFTDDGGVVYIPLESGTPYVVTIVAPGFLTKTFTYTFLAVNNPYTFRLSSLGGTVYTDVFNYTYSPTNTLLVNGSNSFTFNVLSLGSLLEWASINSSLNNSNLSGNPTILVPSIIVDLVNESGNTYPVRFCLKQSNYNQYCFIVNYYVEGRTASNNSLTNSLETFKNGFSGGTSSGWLTLVAVCSILIICVIVSQLSGGNSVATTISGFAGMIVFAYLGWLNVIICGFVCVIGLLLFFFNRTGGTS